MLSFLRGIVSSHGAIPPDRDGAIPPDRDHWSNPPLVAAVHNAQLLVDFASENGKPLDNEVIAKVVKVANALNAGRVSEKSETEFWQAYQKVAETVAPVTIDSIIATRGTSSQHGSTFWRKLTSTPLALRSVFLYRLIALATLLSVIVMQVYWVAGVALTDDVATLETQITELKREGRELDAQLQGSLEGNAAVDIRLAGFAAQITQQGQWLDATYQSLRDWNRNWARLMFFIAPFESDEFEKLDPVAQNRIEKTTALLFLEALAAYGLPLLYGLLGACAYVLRNLEKEIRRVTFSTKSYIGYGLRLSLGPLAGIAVGLVLAPGPEQGASDAQQTLTLRALSPLALAFVAGYGVELIFTAMDRIISAFSRT